MKKFDLNSIISNRTKKEESQIEGQITLQDWMEWKEDIRTRMEDTVENFIVIGYRFKQIKESRMYESDGYKNLEEFAKAEYKISKTVLYRFIKINEKFSVGGDSMEIKPEFYGYGYSQLQEMLYLADEELEEVNTGMTVKEIREMREREAKCHEKNRQEEKEGCRKAEDGEEAAGVEKVAISPLEEPRTEEDIAQPPIADVPDEIGTEKLPCGEKWNAESWKEPEKKEWKPVEMPPADAQYRYPVGKTLAREIRGGLRFLILRTKDPYRVGNILHLQEHNGGEETGEVLDIKITFLIDDHGGLTPGYVALQFELLPPEEKKMEGQMKLEEMMNVPEEGGADEEDDTPDGIYSEGQESDT